MRASLPLLLLILGCTDSRWAKHLDPQARPEPNLAAAARVDQVGRSILAANPVSGLEVSFQVIGNDDLLLFHRDRHGLFISDRLVEECKTDAELAAVLCSELGRMTAEERNLARMGYSEPFNQMPTEQRSSDALSDPIRYAEAVRDERDGRRRSEMPTLTDPNKIAAEFLKAAGHDIQTLTEIEPLLKKTNRQRSILSQLGGGSSGPTWTR